MRDLECTVVVVAGLFALACTTDTNPIPPADASNEAPTVSSSGGTATGGLAGQDDAGNVGDDSLGGANAVGGTTGTSVGGAGSGGMPSGPPTGGVGGGAGF